MYKKITKERADEITAAWDAATDVQRLGMQRIQWLYVSGGNDETDYWEHEPPPLEKAAAARIAELEAALRPFAAFAEFAKSDPSIDHDANTPTIVAQCEYRFGSLYTISIVPFDNAAAVMACDEAAKRLPT